MKRILITGGNGFLGKSVQIEFEKQKQIQQLNNPHFDVIFPTSEECDILDSYEFVLVFNINRYNSSYGGKMWWHFS